MTSPFRPKRQFFLRRSLGSPRRGFPFATPRSPRGRGAAALHPINNKGARKMTESPLPGARYASPRYTGIDMRHVAGCGLP